MARQKPPPMGQPLPQTLQPDLHQSRRPRSPQASPEKENQMILSNTNQPQRRRDGRRGEPCVRPLPQRSPHRASPFNPFPTPSHLFLPAINSGDEVGAGGEEGCTQPSFHPASAHSKTAPQTPLNQTI